MAKRRTRKQKERAAQRPRRQSAQKSASSTPPSAQAESAATSTPANEMVEQAVGRTEPDVWRHRQRIRNIRWSLLVFAVLVAVQTGLWGAMQLGWLNMAMPL